MIGLSKQRMLVGLLVFAGCSSKEMPSTPDDSSETLKELHVGRMFEEMRSGDGVIDAAEQRALGVSVKQYLSYSARQNPEELGYALKHLATDLVNASVPTTPQNIGIVTGAFMFGLLDHVESTQSTFAQRKEMLQRLVASRGELFDTAGHWGPLVAQVIASLSAAYDLHDQHPGRKVIAAQFLGAIKSEWLQLGAPQGWSEADVRVGLGMLDATLGVQDYWR
jgi:hypothetical protein